MNKDEYEALKVERDKHRSMLEANKNLRGHSSYKMVEDKYKDIQRRIKAEFRARFLGSK